MSHFETLENRRHFIFGAPLASFGVTGQVTAPTIGGSDSGFSTVTTQSDGKIVAAVGGGLTRYTTAGVVDKTFGTAGIVGFRGFSFRDFAIDSSGRLDVLASGASGTFVLRYNTTGTLDSSFGSGGTALVESSKTFHPEQLALQSDGKIVVAGTRSDDSTGSTARVYRLNAGGSVDSGFGSSGATSIALGTGNLITPQLGDYVADVRALSNGKIEILGSSYNYQPESYDSDNGYTAAVSGSSIVAIARLTSGGAADSSFGSSGVVRKAAFDDELITSRAGVIRADGSAVITDSDASQAVFVGFSANGNVAYRNYDPSFYHVSDAYSATALGDGRVAFVSGFGQIWTIDSTGNTSNVVTPLPNASTGTAAIGATSSGDLVATFIVGNGLTAVAVDAGKATDARPDNFAGAQGLSTAEDGAGNLDVAFFDTATKTLKFAYRTPTGLWSRVITVDGDKGAGANLSIATTTVGGKSSVAVAYYDAATADLRIAGSTNLKTFAVETVASKGAIGLSPSLQFTDAGGYAVSYYSKTTKSLFYSLKTGTKWTTQLVAAGGAGAWNSLYFDPSSRRPAIAYSGAKNTVMYALKTKAGWSSVVAATTASGAGFVNLAITYSLPVISYYDLANADLVLLQYNQNYSGKWAATTVASKGIVGSYNQLFIDGSGNADLYAWNRSSNSVLKFVVSRYDNSIDASVVATGGGRYLAATGTYSYQLPDADADAIAYIDSASGDVFVR